MPRTRHILIDYTLIVVDRYPRLMEDKSIPDTMRHDEILNKTNFVPAAIVPDVACVMLRNILTV